MPPSNPKTSRAPVPQGKKKTFDDDDDEDDVEMNFHAASSSSGPSRSRPQAKAQPESDDDSDSDDAPEAVGLSAGKRAALRDLEEAKQLAQAKKTAAKLRNQKIAEARQKEAEAAKEAKAARAPKGKKRKNDSDDEDEDGNEDEETRRLRARMEKAMDDDEGDSELDDDSGDGLSDGSENDDAESFHTDSEDDEEEFGDDDEEDEDDFGDDGDEDDEDSDDESETLEEGPIDNATRLMRERMQAAMEAAERRAGIVHPANPAQPTKAAKGTSADKKGAAVSGSRSQAPAAAVVDDAAAWDMSAGVGGPQPLSAAALQRADEEAQESRRQKKEKARLAEEKRRAEEKSASRTKRRKVVEATSRNLGDGRVAKLLQPTLDPSAGGLPPIVDAGRKHKGQAAGQASQKKFMKHAMKSSGQIPNKAAIDSRRKAVGLEKKY